MIYYRSTVVVVFFTGIYIGFYGIMRILRVRICVIVVFVLRRLVFFFVIFNRCILLGILGFGEGESSDYYEFNVFYFLSIIISFF